MMIDDLPELVVIIQCEDVVKRCSGFLCMRDFYDRTGKFEGYHNETRYMTMTCGGVLWESADTKT